MLRFVSAYLSALVNQWLFYAGLMLTFFEIVQFLWKRTWGWPRAHPWKTAAILLIIAQIGAYHDLEFLVGSLRKERDEAVVAKANLEGQVTVKDGQISQLQLEGNQLRDRLADAREVRPIELKNLPAPVVIANEKPIDMPKAKLVFSFENFEKGHKPTIETAQVRKDRKITFDFFLLNHSGATATNLSVWIFICESCKYIELPPNFRVVPSSPLQAVMSLPRLFSTSYLAGHQVTIEIPDSVIAVEFGLRYACDTCVPDQETQRGTVSIRD